MNKTNIVRSIIHNSKGMMGKMITQFERRIVKNNNFWREK